MTCITKDFLISLRACEDQIKLFEEVFPQGTEVTSESLFLAHKKGLNIIWFAEQKLPADALEALAKDPDPEVRCGVAGNPNTPIHILSSLIKDSDSWVRIEMACNPNTPASILAELSKDEDAGVRRATAGNANISNCTLAELALDPDPSVRQEATQSLKNFIP